MEVRLALGGSSGPAADDVDQMHFGHYVIGLVLGLILAAVVLGLWHVTRPPEHGLRWGGTVYTSERQFKEYLEEKGLSYSTWVGRHPGAAPWDAR